MIQMQVGSIVLFTTTSRENLENSMPGAIPSYIKSLVLDMDKKTRDSYWEKLQLRKKDLEEYYRQY